MDEQRLVPLEVAGLSVMDDDDSPVLLLQEVNGTRLLPIWIGHVEAAAIALQMDKDESFNRPLTHDLLSTILETFVGNSEGTVTIDSIDEGVFHARLHVDGHKFDARPSDAVVLALKQNWPIECSASLLDEVGVEVEAAPEDEIDEFRSFLDSVSAEDFSEDNNP